VAESKSACHSIPCELWIRHELFSTNFEDNVALRLEDENGMVTSPARCKPTSCNSNTTPRQLPGPFFDRKHKAAGRRALDAQGNVPIR
jgi:hypothetical protein